MFSTIEGVDFYTSISVIDNSGNLEPFLRDKLLLSVHSSLQHRKTAITDATALTDAIIGRLYVDVDNGSISSSSIAKKVLLTLNLFDKASSIHYQSFHSDVLG